MVSHALADRVVAALRLTLAKEVDRTITLGNDVRAKVAAALASVIDVELAAPQIRETITLRLTPRAVAVLRVCDARVP